MIFFDELEQSARERNIPVMQKEGILFLIEQIKKHKGQSLLEIGSAIGYSSMMMVSNVKGLKVETIERNDACYKEACEHIKAHHLEDRITIYHDDALLFDDQTLKNAPYDIIFIDAAKAQYRKFFEKYVPYLKDDGVVIVDNLDFHGMIHHVDEIENRNTRALVRKIGRFRNWIRHNRDYAVEYFDVGDGVCLITKKKHQLRMALHLTHKDYIHDFKQMGVEMFIVAGDFSAYSPVKYTLDEIAEINERVNETYVMVNGLYDEHELSRLFKYIDELAKLSIRGILFQDFAVLHYVKKKRYEFDMMYAPMTLNTNHRTLNVLGDQGVSSAWVSKEIPLEEQISIKKNTHMPIMIQGHGVQYMMSSKRHLISTYEQAIDRSFNKDNVILHARESDYASHIYEDERGTTIYSVNKLYTLDLFNQLDVFDYLYIETNYMDVSEAIEVTHMYSDCLKTYYDQGLEVYVHHVKEYMPLLKNMSSPLDRGFLHDSTLYRLEDVKRRDRNGSM
jgi:predicted O-methyltransferase YrrM/collagenase-like PrtC family protease